VKAEHTEAVWLTEDTEFTLPQLAELAGISEADVRELVDYGALSPVDPEAPAWIFNGRCLLTVRTACRLRVSFDLEPHGVALIVSLLDRIQALESQIGSLRAQLPQRQH
jgi:chaperone modulatory protein CbpM